MAVVCVNAQDEKPRHEIGVSYGLGVSLIGDGIGNAVGAGIFDVLLSGYEWTNRKEFGTLGVEYFYHLPDAPRTAVGGIFTYARYGEDVEKDGAKIGERTRSYMTLMPSVKYYYVNGKNFGLYSKVAAGVMMLRAKSESDGKSDTDSDFRFMCQASLLGLEAGSQNFRGFFELGAGEQGIILLGLKYKF
jgi:hypothetical protein